MTKPLLGDSIVRPAIVPGVLVNRGRTLRWFPAVGCLFGLGSRRKTRAGEKLMYQMLNAVLSLSVGEWRVAYGNG